MMFRPYLLALFILPLLTACAKDPVPQAEFQQSTFAEYVEQTQAWIRANRHFISDQSEQEVLLNSPFERKPDQLSNKAVLLVHGLSDSPYSFNDLADSLVEKGYVVRTILLAGHGTKPEDLMIPKLEDWVSAVHHHTQLLAAEYDDVWLGGYSTGANLVTSEAIENPEVDGLLLFAPAFKAKSKMVALAPWVKYFVDWADQDLEENLVKYDSLAMNGAGVFYQTSERVIALLDEHTLTIPVFMALSEADSVVDTPLAVERYKTRFNGPKMLTWFGEASPDATLKSTLRSMRLPEYRISNGSHMSLLFSPENPLYGVSGLQRQCNNGQEDEAELNCRQGADVWYSAWGYQEKDKVHARLTWNPYYHEMVQDIVGFMDHP